MVDSPQILITVGHLTGLRLSKRQCVRGVEVHLTKASRLLPCVLCTRPAQLCFSMSPEALPEALRPAFNPSLTKIVMTLVPFEHAPEAL